MIKRMMLMTNMRMEMTIVVRLLINNKKAHNPNCDGHTDTHHVLRIILTMMIRIQMMIFVLALGRRAHE